jgi:hypothetical protein
MITGIGVLSQRKGKMYAAGSNHGRESLPIIVSNEFLKKLLSIII